MRKSLSTGFFLVALLFIPLCLLKRSSGCIEEERRALLKLKQSFKDPGNRLASWNGTECCTWEGVGCNFETGHVYTLLLYNNLDFSPKLSASEVSPSLAELKHLDSLSMVEFDFQGSPIPEFLGSFKNLRNLDLYGSGFRGPIPESLGNLSNLLFLDLSGNQLSGFIPKSLAKSAKYFDSLLLSGNRLEGPIPESLGRLSELTSLDLSDNLLNGSIPSSLGRISGLTLLNLSKNKLSGTIPNSLWNLSMLNRLDISFNSLEGTISELNFANLSKLTSLSIGSNNLAIRIESDWTPNVNLALIDMSFCSLGSEFPQWIQTQTGLRFLDLSSTNISGSFPKWLRRMPELYHLDLSANQIIGDLPINTVDKLPGLQTLRLRNNVLTGPVPESFCKFRRMQVLDLSRNNLSGELPDCWGNLHDLVVVLFSSNNFSGKIPISILRNYYSLRQLHLGDNSLVGELPLTLKNCTRLEILDLGENSLSGAIPPWIGTSLSSLRVLRLRNNMFIGEIPSELCWRTELQILDLGLNGLSGEIPRCFDNITRMTDRYAGPKEEEDELLAPDDYDSEEWDREEISQVIKGIELEYTTTLKLLDSIDLSSNELSGSIPEELCKLSRLRSLNLSRNRLSGNIPGEIGGFKSIESIDLSNNQLFGEIPQGISSLKYVNHLNLSHNNLTGKIPTSDQLRTLNDPSIYAGNLQLCGDPLPEKCPGDDGSDETLVNSRRNDEDKSENIWFYLSVGFGYVTGLWAVFFTLLFKRSWRVCYFQFVDRVKERAFGKCNVCVM